MWLTRRHLLTRGAAALAGMGGGATRAAPLAELRTGPLALNGFDVVSYYLDGPVPGRGAFEVAWNGRTWRFAGAGNREAFRRDPALYAPRLGGFDPVGVAAGRLVDTDPLIFARLPGPEGVERLYLLRNAEHRARLLAEPDIAARAEERWPALKSQIERDFPE